jgi:hypothetical protein
MLDRVLDTDSICDAKQYDLFPGSFRNSISRSSFPYLITAIRAVVEVF